MKTIEGLASLLGIPTSKTLKAVFYSSDGEVVFVVIRGDLEVNEIKLRNALGPTSCGSPRPKRWNRPGWLPGPRLPLA